ncbi:hypothetical protein J6590_026709 [Homalodisca vitripennis]|nr:hypothetical protein J6590_026709 [Homalodisca vitripennis]
MIMRQLLISVVQPSLLLPIVAGAGPYYVATSEPRANICESRAKENHEDKNRVGAGKCLIAALPSSPSANCTAAAGPLLKV